jgi:hypothetical protein
MSKDLYTDALRQIDEMESAELTVWESDFIDLNLARAAHPGNLPVSFTDRQRLAIIRMAEKYLSDDIVAELKGQQRLFGDKT